MQLDRFWPRLEVFLPLLIVLLFIIAAAEALDNNKPEVY